VKDALFAVLDDLAQKNEAFLPKTKRLFYKKFPDGYAVALGFVYFEEEAPFGYFVANWGKAVFPETPALIEDYLEFLSPEEVVDTVIGQSAETDFLVVPFSSESWSFANGFFQADAFLTLTARLQLICQVKRESAVLFLRAITPYGTEDFPLIKAGKELEVNLTYTTLFDDEKELFEWLEGVVKSHESKVFTHNLLTYLGLTDGFSNR